MRDFVKFLLALYDTGPCHPCGARPSPSEDLSSLGAGDAGLGGSGAGPWVESWDGTQGLAGLSDCQSVLAATETAPSPCVTSNLLFLHFTSLLLPPSSYFSWLVGFSPECRRPHWCSLLDRRLWVNECCSQRLIGLALEETVGSYQSSLIILSKANLLLLLRLS